MVLGSTQPLTEASTRNLPGGKVRPARTADKLTALWEPIFEKTWEPPRLKALWVSTACYRDSFTCTFDFILSVVMSDIKFISDVSSTCKNGNFSHTDQVGLGGKASDLHSGGANFEFQPGHLMLCKRFFMAGLSPSSHNLSNSSFINHVIIRRFTVWAINSVVT
jgi:hypothetical protein